MMAISERPDTTDDFTPSPYVGQRMTLEEFLALPDEKPALEYADGVVTQKMAPTPDHIELQAIIRDTLNATAEHGHLGRAFTEIRFQIQGLARVPDVGFYRLTRLRVIAGRRYASNQGVPDLAVEIVSPGQSVTSLILKCQQYLALGALVALIVDPDDEAILAFRPGQPVRVLQGDDRIEIDELVPGLALTVKEMFEAIVPIWVAEGAQDAGDRADEAEVEGQADDEAGASERSDG
jgi:Uma2 family endonuclease